MDNKQTNTSTAPVVIGSKNGKTIKVSHMGNIDCYTMVDKQGKVVDSYDKVKSESIPARFIPER